MTIADTAAAHKSDADAALKVIDCDVHPTVSGGLSAVYPYMPKAWSKRFEQKKASVQSVALTTKYLHPNGAVVREDTRDEKGNVGGSDPKAVVSGHINPCNIDIALLNGLQTASLCAALATTDESIILASAFNDFFLEEWLPVDRRLRYALTVA